MKEFYTFVDQQGSRIFHRYWNGNSRASEVIEEFPIQLFIENNKGNDIGLHGERLGKMNFTTIKSVQDFIREHRDVVRIHGQTSMVHQFLAHRYPEMIEFDMDKFVIANFDIETRSDMGFPFPDKAEQEIISITLKCFGDDKFYTWGTKPYSGDDCVYFLCDDESKLLLHFVDFWSKLKPDIITGWNIIGFDIPYLVNRITRVHSKKVASRLSPFASKSSNVFSEFEIQGEQQSYRILGVTAYDYLELYKKFSTRKLEKYSLDFVSHVELSERKLDYSVYSTLSNLYESNHDKFIEYNVHDVRLVENLDKKMNFIFLSLTMAFLGKVRMNEIFSQVRFWDNLVYNKLLTEGVQIPPETHRAKADGIEGAFVKDPVPGLYKWVVSLDLTSLYPSIIMQYNLSPETAVSPAIGNLVDKMIEMSYNTSHLKEKDVTMTANGATFSRKTKGVMPRLMDSMFSDRKKYKKMMLDTRKDIELITAEMKKRGLNP